MLLDSEDLRRRLLRRRRRWRLVWTATAAVDVEGPAPSAPALPRGSVSTVVRGRVSVVSNIFSSVGELGQFCGNTSSMVMKASSPSECCPMTLISSEAWATRYSSGGRRSKLSDSVKG